MFRLFSSPASALIGVSTAYLGGTVLGYGSGMPSMSTLLSINALGNFSLSLALGTLLEKFSLGWLLATSVKDSTTNAPIHLRLANTAIGATGLTVREILGATLGYGMFTLAKQPTDISLSAFLLVVGTGSAIFSGAIPVAVEVLNKIAIVTSSGLGNALANNADDIFKAMGGPSDSDTPRYRR